MWCKAAGQTGLLCCWQAWAPLVLIACLLCGVGCLVPVPASLLRGVIFIVLLAGMGAACAERVSAVWRWLPCPSLSVVCLPLFRRSGRRATTSQPWRAACPVQAWWSCPRAHHTRSRATRWVGWWGCLWGEGGWNGLLLLPLASLLTILCVVQLAGNFGWLLRALTVLLLLCVLVGAALLLLLLPAGQRQLPFQVDQQEMEGGLLRDQHGHQPHALGSGHEPQRRLRGPGACVCLCLVSVCCLCVFVCASALCVRVFVSVSVASTQHGCTSLCLPPARQRSRAGGWHTGLHKTSC